MWRSPYTRTVIQEVLQMLSSALASSQGVDLGICCTWSLERRDDCCGRLGRWLGAFDGLLLLLCFALGFKSGVYLSLNPLLLCPLCFRSGVCLILCLFCSRLVPRTPCGEVVDRICKHITLVLVLESEVIILLYEVLPEDVQPVVVSLTARDRNAQESALISAVV